MLKFHLLDWKCLLLIDQVNCFLFLHLFLSKLYILFMLIEVDDLFIVTVLVWNLFDAFIILVVIDCAQKLILFIDLPADTHSSTADATATSSATAVCRFLVDEDSKATVCAADQEDVPGYWRGTGLRKGWEPMVLELLELHSLLRCEDGHWYTDSRVQVFSEGRKILVGLYSILFMKRSSTSFLRQSSSRQ